MAVKLRWQTKQGRIRTWSKELTLKALFIILIVVIIGFIFVRSLIVPESFGQCLTPGTRPLTAKHAMVLRKNM
jgi:hypothetical protein